MEKLNNLINKYWLSRPVYLRLIILNVAVFAVVRIAGICALIANGSIDPLIDNLALSSSVSELASHPWTPFTYMFLHYDVMHIFFNMLLLYWMGSLLTYRCTQRQFLSLYLLGGLGGAVAYISVARLTVSVSGLLLGASASVIAIAVAAAVMMPRMRVNLALIGGMQLRWIVLLTLAMFLLGLVGNDAGAHVAHLGGAATGALFALVMDGKLKRWFNTLFSHSRRGGFDPYTDISSAGGASSSSSKSSSTKSSTREIPIDEILDKVKRSGYSALTEDERRRLFKR